ncbi:MAG: hypothetical protein ACYTBJ_16850, partial [Planctomycetota bacterium]|jgi:hypothetical protein
LNKAGVRSRQALFEADLSAIARTARAPVERFEAFRLHAEMAHVESFVPEAAMAMVTHAGIKTRQQLAIAQPSELLRAVTKAEEAGLIEPGRDFSGSAVYGWIGYAKGFDPAPTSSKMNMKQVLTDSKLVTDLVLQYNPGCIITAVAGLFNPFSRLQSMAQVRALMEDAGVTDLSALGTFRIKGNRVIGPGYYIARPLSLSVTKLAKVDLLTAMIGKGALYKRVESLPDCIRLVPNPVRDAVIIGNLVQFVESARLIIGKEVTSLTIITDQILYSQVNEIVYEDSGRAPQARAQMSPARAATGTPRNDRNVYTPNGDNRGRNGGRGSPGQNGGAGYAGDVLGPGPDVTIYVQRTPEGLPDINIGGRRGGAGQPGQHGGHGSDGARGRPAQSGACQCWRGAGRGGNGGDGGRGGDGGVGGAGGSGGDLTIHTLDENIVRLATDRPYFVDISGGPGGNGGARGVAGEGGRGGAPGDDSWPWCDEEPSRVGADGGRGADGRDGANGANGPNAVFTLQPITLSDWNAVFNLPWIVRLEPWEGRTGQTVRVVARNITNDTVVLFGTSIIIPSNVDVAAGTLQFVVPTNTGGGRHSVVLRLAGVNAYVYSNTVEYRVLAHLASLTPDNGVPGTTIRLRGTGFMAGAQVRFAGTTYPANYLSDQELELVLPDHENIATDAGTKDVQVVNPDGRASEVLTFELTLDIVVRVKAWLVFPDLWVGGGGLFGGPGPERDEDDIRELFTQDPTPRQVWIGHHVVLEFDPVVGTAAVPADWAESWPIDGVTFTENEDMIRATDAAGNFLHFENGAVNFYFVDDVDDWTTHAYTYRGSETRRQEFVIFEDTPLLSDWEEAHVSSHELGHVFGLPHVCGTDGDETFGRACTSEDNDFLMHPSTHLFMDEGNTLTVEEARIARRVARLWHNL